MSVAPNLDRLDAARGGPFRYRFHGGVETLPDPADLSFEAVLTILTTGMIMPPYVANLGQAEALFAAWAAHYDLPDLKTAQRLAYSVNRYRDDLEYDLRVHAHMDLGEMWRSRRWRTLMATIDRLPSHSYHAEAVSKDPEHAAMLAEALAARPDDGTPSEPPAPPLRTWTPEVQVLTAVLDGIRDVGWVLRATNSEKGKQPPHPGLSPRPKSAIEDATKRADYDRRKSRHDSLAARLLPHKAPGYVKPELPPGWRYDSAGRLRNERGRYAKKPHGTG